jgi:periplasmic protein TonB
MEPLAILRADPLDLLFENRNQSYGAYPLRKYYPQRLLVSMGLVFSLVVILSFLYLHFQGRTIKKNIMIIPDPILLNVNLNPAEKPILPLPIAASSTPKASVEWVTPLIVKDQDQPHPIAKIEDLSQAAISVSPSSGEVEQGRPETNGQSGGSALVQKDSVDENSEIFDHPEVMPQFPGGEDALKRFLMKNLRMPDNSLETGSQVKVIARFVVGPDGKVRDIEITQAADEVFNREVKRVILKMPDWKPGMQHNRNVAVYFSLPVNFIAEE